MAPSGPVPPGGSIVIRELRRSDETSFSEVMLGSYGPFEAMLGLGRKGTSEFAGFFRPGIWYVLRFFRAIGAAPIRMFVAADGSTVVGSTLVLAWPNSGYVLGVGVRPTYRRRGIAGRLIERAEQLTRKKRRAWAVLDVEEENHAAVTLYRARQYETIQRSVWLQCDAPAGLVALPRSGRSVRRVGKSGRKAAAAWCATRIPPPFAAVLPPNPSRLTHLESLGQWPGAVRETWSVGAEGQPVGYLAAVRRTPGMPGILFVPALDPSATRDDIAGVVQEGAAWLLAQGSTSVLIAVPDHARAALPVVEGLGFTPQLSTLTMARRLDGSTR